MKKYIGTRPVKAEPMTLGEAYKLGLLPECMKSKEDESNSQNKGYKITGPLGYEVWIPEDEFNSSYKIAETELDRLKIELQEVKERLIKLSEYMYSAEHPKINKEEKYRLNEQKGAMERYVSILIARIYDAQSPDKTNEIEEIPCSGRPFDCECADGAL